MRPPALPAHGAWRSPPQPAAAASPPSSLTAPSAPPTPPHPDDDAAPEASQPDASRDPGFSGMELEFLGTSSGQPTLWRNVSALGVRFPAENWLFDCGEGTQHRLMVSSLAYPRITRIFVTHTHGDHIFGLPGVIASISGARSATKLVNPRPWASPRGIFGSSRRMAGQSHTRLLLTRFPPSKRSGAHAQLEQLCGQGRPRWGEAPAPHLRASGERCGRCRPSSFSLPLNKRRSASSFVLARVK